MYGSELTYSQNIPQDPFEFFNDMFAFCMGDALKSNFQFTVSFLILLVLVLDHGFLNNGVNLF